MKSDGGFPVTPGARKINTMETKRILVVDDESQITRVLRRSLTAHRYDVRTAADGESALDTLRDFHPDLIITDLSMPGMDGIELCREIRRISQVPIIVLSVKGEEKVKVSALDAGADDYITKPFGIDELLARIRAALRRATDEKSKVETTLEVGDFSVNHETRQIFVAGQEIHLTPKEFELLTYLIKNHGKVITHRTMLGAVWGGNFTEQTEYLRVFLGNLRKKIEPNPSKPKYILTEPWVGYRFNSGER
jgi:two-component system KDP operon response regulator KdpE